jgi:hypothetical protein
MILTGEARAALRFTPASRVLSMRPLTAMLPLPGRAAAFTADIVLDVFPLAALGSVDPAAGIDLSVRLGDEISGLGGAFAS